jgi:hypothetical protein
MRYENPRFLDQGDTALTVEFGDAVDPEINARVLALDAAFRAAAPPGVRETTPTYRSLLVHYEPMEISRAALVAWVEAHLPESVTASEAKQSGGRDEAKKKKKKRKKLNKRVIKKRKQTRISEKNI